MIRAVLLYAFNSVEVVFNLKSCSFVYPVVVDDVEIPGIGGNVEDDDDSDEDYAGNNPAHGIGQPPGAGPGGMGRGQGFHPGGLGGGFPGGAMGGFQGFGRGQVGWGTYSIV